MGRSARRPVDPPHYPRRRRVDIKGTPIRHLLPDSGVDRAWVLPQLPKARWCVWKPRVSDMSWSRWGRGARTIPMPKIWGRKRAVRSCMGWSAITWGYGKVPICFAGWMRRGDCANHIYHREAKLHQKRTKEKRSQQQEPLRLRLPSAKYCLIAVPAGALQSGGGPATNHTHTRTHARTHARTETDPKKYFLKIVQYRHISP